jgi:fatty-acyl-CoA synthase
MEVTQTPLRFLRGVERAHGAKEAVRCGGQRFTWAEHAARVRRVAAALTALGIGPGDTVAYLGLNCHRLLELYYAVPAIGAVLLPLNVRLAPQELAYIMDDSRCRLLFAGPPLAPLAVGVLALVPRHLPLVWAGDDPAPPALDVPTYEALLSGAGERELDGPVAEDQVAELFYTSGTTGRPKGVMLTHRNLYAHALAVLSMAEYDATTRVLHTLPLFHVNGWGTPHTMAAVGGGHVVMSHFDAQTALGHLRRDGVTTFYLVPTMGLALLEALRQEGGGPVQGLKRVMVGGAAAPPSLVRDLQRALGAEVVAGYGLSETTPVVSVSRVTPAVEALPEDARWAQQASAGVPLPGVEVAILDEDDRPVPQDGRTPGELCVRGDIVMRGYLNLPEETAQALRGGFLHTGDVATWDPMGYLHIIDRKKDLVISGGENISSAEVENALYTHPAVLECAVVAGPDPYWGEVPHAFVVVRPGTSVTADELVQHVRGQLAHFKAPRGVTFVDTLPKTGTGKVQKNLLRARLRQDDAAAGAAS